MQVSVLKKYLKKCLCLYICFSIVFDAYFPTPAVSSAESKIKLSKTSITIKAGKSKTIKLKKNGKKLKAKFSSNKPKIAKVGKKSGKITGKKKGKCTITVKYAGKKYKCKVKVTKNTSSKPGTNQNSEGSNPETNSNTENKSPETSQNPDTDNSSGTGAGGSQGSGNYIEDGYYPGTGDYTDGEGYPGAWDYTDGEGYPDNWDYTEGEDYPGIEDDPGFEDTQDPYATKKPSASTKPRNTKSPSVTKKPLIIVEPDDTNTPDYGNQEGEDPYTTYEPEGDGFPEGEDPYGTYEPEGNDFPEWEDPYETYEPSDGNDITDYEDPYTTYNPGTTKKPAVTNKPVASQKPYNTQSPVTSQKPVNTQSPVASNKPDVTSSPDYGNNIPEGEGSSNPNDPDYTNTKEPDTAIKHYLSPYWTVGVNTYDNKGSSFTMGGKTYTQGICEAVSANTGNTRDNYIIYNLDSNFSTVSFDVGCVDYSDRSNVSISVEAGGNIYPGGYPDDYEIERLQVFCWGRQVKRVTINTVGVKQLRISIFGVYGIYGIGNVTGDGGHVFERSEFRNATANQGGGIIYRCKYCNESYKEFTSAQTECKPALVPYNTNSVRLIDSDYDGECFKVMGKEYCKGLIPDYSQKQVEWSFKLDKKYKSITFSIGPLDKNFNNKTFYGLALYVYADGRYVKFNENGKQSDYIMLGTFMLNKTFTINTEGITELRFKSGGEVSEHYAFFDITYETVERNAHEFQNVNGREKCINCGCYKD